MGYIHKAVFRTYYKFVDDANNTINDSVTLKFRTRSL